MIIINGIRWDLLLVDPSNTKLQIPNGKRAFGCCDNFTHILYISKNLNKKALKKVLRHEITHAFIYSHNILLTPKEEETVVEIVTNYGQQINKIANRAYKQIKEGKY